jgi:hypothetical protein
MDSSVLTLRSHEATCPTLLTEAEKDASREKQAALVAKATAEALLLPALQESLARLQEVEERLNEEQDRNKKLTEKCEAKSIRVQHLEEELKLMTDHHKEMTAKCATESVRAQQLDKSLDHMELIDERLKASCLDRVEQLELVLEECATMESKVMELTSDSDSLTLLNRWAVCRISLARKELAGLARDFPYLSTMVFGRNAAIEDEDTDTCPQKIEIHAGAGSASN